MRRISLLFLLLNFSFLQAQICDTMNAKRTKDLSKVYQKCKEKISEKKDIYISDPDLIFDIANYLRQKNDTSCRYWYKLAEDRFKKDYQYGRKNAAKKAMRLYRIGLCYFYLENYVEAESYLAKAISAKYNNACKYYFYSYTLKKIGKNKEAEEQFKLFREETKPLSKESREE